MSLVEEFDIKIRPYFRDHRIGQVAVLPAVEAMRILGTAVGRMLPQFETRRMAAADFKRFVPLAEDNCAVRARVALATDGGQWANARLLTRFQSKTGSLVRWIEHVQIRFQKSPPPADEPHLPNSPIKFERPFEIDAERVYQDLVPFGPAYRNLAGTLSMGPGGVLARVRAAAVSGSDDPRLGSPFALDAAFHAACVWGQRYADRVTYPTGFEARSVYRPTRAGQIYRATVFSRGAIGKGLAFDLELSDSAGNCCEWVENLRMQDILAGRRRPPDWIRR